MNERIKKLADQAGWRYVLGGNPRTLIEDRDYLVTNEQAEKFAELIVKECIQQLRYKSAKLVDVDYFPEYKEHLL